MRGQRGYQEQESSAHRLHQHAPHISSLNSSGHSILLSLFDMPEQPGTFARIRHDGQIALGGDGEGGHLVSAKVGAISRWM